MTFASTLGRLERHPEVAHRGEGVALELAHAGGREVVEREGQVREVAEEAEADVAPVDAGVEVLVDRGLDARLDLAAEEQRQDEQQHEQERDYRPGPGQDAGGSLHLLPQVAAVMDANGAMLKGSRALVDGRGLCHRGERRPVIPGDTTVIPSRVSSRARCHPERSEGSCQGTARTPGEKIPRSARDDR